MGLAACLVLLAPVSLAGGGEEPDDEAGHGAASSSTQFEETIVFANESFYRDRPEPERTVRGILFRVDAVTGPDTREHPIRLSTEAGEWGVYVAGLPEAVLDSIVDRPWWITGKWIPADEQNPVEEVWIGRVRQ